MLPLILVILFCSSLHLLAAEYSAWHFDSLTLNQKRKKAGLWEVGTDFSVVSVFSAKAASKLPGLGAGWLLCILVQGSQNR